MSFKLLISSTLTNLCCVFVTEVRRLCVNKEGWSPRSIVQTSFFLQSKNRQLWDCFEKQCDERRTPKVTFYIFLVSQFVNEVENSVQGILLC